MVNTIKLTASAMDELNFDDLLGDKLFDGLDMDLDDDLPNEMKEVMGDMCVEALSSSVMLAAEEKILASASAAQQKEEEDAAAAGSSTKKKKSKKKGKKKGKKKNKEGGASGGVSASSGNVDTIGTLDKNALESIHKLNVMNSTGTTMYDHLKGNTRMTSTTKTTVEGDGTTTIKVKRPNENASKNSFSSSVITDVNTKGNKIKDSATSDKPQVGITTGNNTHPMANTTMNTAASEDPIWSIFPYKNVPSDVSLKRSHKLYPNLEILHTTFTQQQQQQSSDMNAENTIFSLQSLHAIRSYLSSPTPNNNKKQQQNVVLQGILPELSSCLHLLYRQYNFLSDTLYKLNKVSPPIPTKFKRFVVTIRLGGGGGGNTNTNTNTDSNIWNNNTNSFLTSSLETGIGISSMITPTLIANISSNYAFHSSSPSTTTNATIHKNRKRKNKNQSTHKTSQQSSTTCTMITPIQRQKNISTYLSSKAQTLHEKSYKNIQTKRKLHHMNKVIDLEDIALLDEEPPPPPPSESSSSEIKREEKYPYNLHHKKEKDLEPRTNDTNNDNPMLLNTLAMHAWIDTTGYLEDEYTTKDIIEELGDLWQPIWKTDDLEYVYGPVPEYTPDPSLRIRNNNNKDEEKRDNPINGDDTNKNYSFMDRLQSLLVVEEDDDDTNEDSVLSSSNGDELYHNVQQTSAPQNQMKNHNKNRKKNTLHKYPNKYKNKSEYILDVSNLTIDERLYIQLRSINLTTKKIHPQNTSSNRTNNPYNELNQCIHALSNKVSNLHSSNNKKLAWLQYASNRHLSLCRTRSKEKDDMIQKYLVKNQQLQLTRLNSRKQGHLNGGCGAKDGNNGGSRSGKKHGDTWIPW